RAATVPPRVRPRRVRTPFDRRLHDPLTENSMSSYTMDCPPFDPCGACGTLPSGFVRLRYFFGKRMGVADFLDEQRYHTGKMRFHNQRLHGAGVLCGPGVARQATTDLILRVGKAAASTASGREIVVG